MSILVNAVMDPRSAVAAQTRELIDVLSRSHSVEVWSPEGHAGTDDLPCEHREVDPFDPALPLEARRFTHVIHVMAGSRSHAGVGRIARHVPGIVVLHDVSLLEPLKEDIRAQGGSTQDLLDTVRFLHGPLMATRLELEYVFPGTGTESPDLHQSAHAMPYFLNAATAVVTHSEWAARRVRAVVATPVLVARLPAEPYEPPGGTAGTLPVDAAAPVVVPGIVNRHKMVSTVIEGFAESGLARAGHPLLIMGPCDARMEANLRLAARRAGVEEALRFAYPLNHDDFLAQLTGALAVVSLREFNTEAQSAALLAGLLSGRPVIASDDGSVRDLPDDLIIKVAGENAGREVAHGLRGVADGSVDVAAITAAASQWIQREHTLPGYVAVLEAALAVHERRRVEVTASIDIVERLTAAGLAGQADAVGACADALDSLAPR
jgi:glycosyltransferase involved in cell wall biosynthesis